MTNRSVCLAIELRLVIRVANETRMRTRVAVVTMDLRSNKSNRISPELRNVLFGEYLDGT